MHHSLTSAVASVRLSEIFTSIEGEGILFGTKTMFVRLAGCPLKCHWCDTPYALDFRSGEALTLEDAKHAISSGLKPHTYKVNFTGGEPLVQHEAVIELAKFVHSLGLKTYLESSCYDSVRFAQVLPFMDICKIEFKMSDSKVVEDSQYQTLLRNEFECLRLAVSASAKNARPTVYIKVVVSNLTSITEFRKLVTDIFAVVSAQDVTGFIIQPSDQQSEPSLDRLVEFYDEVYPFTKEVRIIPQLHKVLGAR